MIDLKSIEEAARLLDELRSRGMMVATAESCTGGLVAATLTHIAGSSDVVDRGFVTYSNAAKSELLGVDPETIETFGAVSESVAGQMARGALDRSDATIAIAVTGIAGPGGASLIKPVGLVWFGVARRGGPDFTEQRVFSGDRAAVRQAAVAHALRLVLRAVAG